MSLDAMIKRSVRCVKCGAGFGQCDCWTTCPKCKCMYETGTECRRCKGDATPEIAFEATARRGRKRADTADQSKTESVK